ncbi:MAG: hypothetical protein QW721_02815 [Desulfurococcaceae archaeon]
MKRIVYKALLGVIEGVVFYYLFIVLVPWFFADVLKIPLPEVYTTDSARIVLYLGVFTGLGLLSSLVKAPIGLVFDVMLSVLALSLLLRYTGYGVFREVMVFGGVTVEAEFKMVILLALIVGFTVLNTLMRIFEKITSVEEL